MVAAGRPELSENRPSPTDHASHGARRGEPQTDRAALEKLADWCGRFSPVVGIEEAAAPESLLLDITGLDALFGGEAQLAGEILRELAATVLRRWWPWPTPSAPPGPWHILGQGRKGVGERGGGDHWQRFPRILHPSSFILHPSLAPCPVDRPAAAGTGGRDAHQLGIDRIGQLEMLPRQSFYRVSAPSCCAAGTRRQGGSAKQCPCINRSPSGRPVAGSNIPRRGGKPSSWCCRNCWIVWSSS